MCPFRYLYHVLLFLLTNFLIISNTNAAVEWKAYFDPNPITIKTASRQRVSLVLAGLPEEFVDQFQYPNHTDQQYIQLVSEDASLASIRHQDKMTVFALNKTALDTKFDLFGEFLGEHKLIIFRKKVSLHLMHDASLYQNVCRSNENLRDNKQTRRKHNRKVQRISKRYHSPTAACH